MLAPRQDIVAVIPAYQCAATIGEVVAATLGHVARVIVVDDGSSDGSGEAALAAGAEVIRHPANRGKGAALRTAFAALLAEVAEPTRNGASGAGGSLGELAGSGENGASGSPGGLAAVAMLDGDGQHDPDDLVVLLAAWDEGRWDLIVGGRLADRALIPPHRYWTNRIGTGLLSFATGVRLGDSQSGYRLIAADLLARLDLASDGYAIESEMLIKAARRGARIGEVRIRTIYHDRVPSFYRPVRDTVTITLASAYHRLFDRG